MAKILCSYSYVSLYRNVMPSTCISTNKYANSRPIDLNWDSDDPAVEQLVEEIKKELFDNGMYKHVRNSRELVRIHNHIKFLLLDLFLAYLSDKKLYLGYSRTKGHYKQDGRYNYQRVSYAIFVTRIIDGLIFLKYLKGKKGFHDNSRSYGWQSRIKASKKLTKKFLAHNLTREMIKKNSNEEIIIMRDKIKSIIKTKKKIKTKTVKIDIPYKDTRKVKKLRENLNYINETLENTFIGLYITDEEFNDLRKTLRRADKREPINFSNKRLRRIFNNNSWGQGGRFYGGWWQLIPKEYRKFISIGGGKFGAWPKKYSVEYDYNAQHARMLYAEIGIDYKDEDPYEIEGVPADIRKLLKRTFNIIVNTKSENKAITAVNRRIKKKRWKLPPKIENGEDLIKLTKEKHDKIAHLLFESKGPFLQNLDSQIAEKVMLKMFKRGARVLPVHDSFLVSNSWEIDIQPVMEEAFKEIVGVHCPAVRKETMGEFNLKNNSDKAKARLYNLDKVYVFDGKTYVEEKNPQSANYSIYEGMLSDYEEAHVKYDDNIVINQ